MLHGGDQMVKKEKVNLEHFIWLILSGLMWDSQYSERLRGIQWERIFLFIFYIKCSFSFQLSVIYSQYVDIKTCKLVSSFHLYIMFPYIFLPSNTFSWTEALHLPLSRVTLYEGAFYFSQFCFYFHSKDFHLLILSPFLFPSDLSAFLLILSVNHSGLSFHSFWARFWISPHWRKYSVWCICGSYTRR